MSLDKLIEKLTVDDLIKKYDIDDKKKTEMVNFYHAEYLMNIKSNYDITRALTRSYIITDYYFEKIMKYEKRSD